jgi:fatty-acyl-CoA synthase
MNLAGRVGSVGRAHPFQHHNLKLAAYDVSRQELVRDGKGFLIPAPIGQPGELLGKITRNSFMPYEGYTDRKASAAKVVHNAFRQGDSYFRTGDLLRRDAEGYYYFVDRIGDTFRWKGENVSTQEVAEILNGAPGVTETNVYGVEVPGHDGRAGSAAVVSDGPFDAAGFYRQAEQLPAYARPLFVRIVPAMTTTGTLKQKKIDLQNEGFDPQVIKDAIFFRSDDSRAYVPLTPELYASIRSGRIRV